MIGIDHVYIITEFDKSDGKTGRTFVTKSDRIAKAAESVGFIVKTVRVEDEESYSEELSAMECLSGKIPFVVSFAGSVIIKVDELPYFLVIGGVNFFGKILESKPFGTTQTVVAAKSKEEAIKLAVDIMSQAQNNKSLYLN